MNFHDNQEQLMTMIIDKVFDKHKVKAEKDCLTKEEKAEVENVLEIIKKDVERFIENQTKGTTEKTVQTQHYKGYKKSTKSGKRKYKGTQTNDVQAVKNFLSIKKF